MTDEQSSDEDLQADFEELANEMDAVQEKFERTAEENRRAREEVPLEDRQDTEGEQPEREFESRVFLVVPHNYRNPPTASFTKSVYQVVSGDVASFTVDLTNTSTASVVVGDGTMGYEVSFEVVDTSGDGSVTVSMDTGRAGQSQYDVDTVFSAGQGDALRNVRREEMPNVGPVPLDYGTYDMAVLVDGRETDLAVLEIQARPSTTRDGAAASVGAGGAGIGAVGAVAPGADPVAAVASGPGAVDAGSASVGVPVDDADGRSIPRGATAGRNRQRPLPRRPDARPPLRSSGLTVKRNGTPTEFVQPGGRYTVECTVENGGGLGANTVDVEVFAEHRSPTATVDTDGTEFTAVRGQYGRLGGYTTLPPGHNYAVLGFVGSTPRPRNVTFRSFGGAATVDSDRTFDQQGQFGIETSSITGDEFVDESALRSNTFTMRLYWTTGIDLTKDRYRLQIDQNDTEKEIDQKQQTTASNVIDALENRAVQLTEVPGRFQSSQTNTRGPLDLDSTITDATLLPNGKGRIQLPPRGSGTFTCDYTAPSSRGDRVLTALYARTYSLAPEDDPASWQRLDHTQSRFMGRNELYWQGAKATD